MSDRPTILLALRELRRTGAVYAFSRRTRQTLRHLADEPGIEVTEYEPPLRRPEFAAPVLAVATLKSKA